MNRNKSKEMVCLLKVSNLFSRHKSIKYFSDRFYIYKSFYKYFFENAVINGAF